MRKVIVVFLCVCLALGSCAGAFAASKERMIRGGGSRADQSGASVDPGKGGASVKNRAARQGSASANNRAARQGSSSAKNRAARQGRASAAYGDDAYLLELLSDFMRGYENPEEQLGMWLADAYENGLFSEVDSPEKGYWLEETADDVEKISAEDQERLLPWAKENAEEQLIHEEDARIIQNEENLNPIAGVKVTEKELRETVIRDAMKQVNDGPVSKFPFYRLKPQYDFFAQNADKSISSLEYDKYVYGFIRSNGKTLVRELIETGIFDGIIGKIIRIVVKRCAAYTGFQAGCTALINSKKHFHYKV